MNGVINIIWLVSDKMVRLLFGLFTITFLANRLSIQDFGYYNYIVSLVFIITPFATLGLDNNLTKEFIKNSKNTVFNSAIFIKLVASLLTILAPLLYYIVSNEEIFLILSVCNISYLAKSVDVIRFYWESELENKYNAIIECSVFIISNLIKIAIVLFDYNLELLIYTIAIEGIIYTIFILTIIKIKKIDLFVFGGINFCYIKGLVKQSLPLMISSLSVMIYMKIDQVMLAHLSTYEEVGVMALASKFSQSWYFIPTSIITVLFSYIASDYKSNKNIENSVIDIYSVLHIISFFAIVSIYALVSWFSVYLIPASYQNIDIVLIIHMIGGFFMCINTFRSRLLSLKEKQIIVFYLTTFGALINVVLNFILIPDFGAVGAAIATLSSQFSVSFIIPNFIPGMKEYNRSVYLSLINFRLLVSIRKYVKY